MDDLDIFDHRVALFNTVLASHIARCLAKAGLLDADARSSIASHFRDIAETAIRIDRPEPRAWIEMIGSILPPGPVAGGRDS